MNKVIDNSEFTTIADTRRQLLARNVSPSEVLTHFLGNIAVVDPQVKAWVYINQDEAIAHARELDKQMAAVEETSPLFGIPYGAKDIFHTRGIPTQAGSKVLKSFVPDDNASVIDMLHEQGALLLGKTSTTEFANLGTPPQTGNAWNQGHTPGGSSSGSAAALASRTALMTLGTQTAGSLSRPASYNGLTVLKASYGRISKAGVIPASWSLDHVGAFTHTVEDAALVYNALAGPDSRDETTLQWPRQRLETGRRGHYTVGYVEHPWYANADGEILSACEQALKAMTGEGITIKRVGLPVSFLAANRAHQHVMQAECACYHAENFRKDPTLFGDYLQEFIAEGLTISANDYLQAQQIRKQYRLELNQMFDSIDLLMTPATETVAPAGLLKTGSPSFNMPFTNAGVPTLALPVGFSQTGLPIGMQLIAATGNEQLLIDVGQRYQQITDWHAVLPEICQR